MGKPLTRLTPEQVVKIGTDIRNNVPVKTVCEKYQISLSTYWAWKKRLANGMDKDKRRSVGNAATSTSNASGLVFSDDALIALRSTIIKRLDDPVFFAHVVGLAIHTSSHQS